MDDAENDDNLVTISAAVSAARTARLGSPPSRRGNTRLELGKYAGTAIAPAKNIRGGQR